MTLHAGYAGTSEEIGFGPQGVWETGTAVAVHTQDGSLITGRIAYADAVGVALEDASLAHVALSHSRIGQTFIPYSTISRIDRRS